MKKDNVLILGGIIVDSIVTVEEYPQRGQDILIHDSFDRVGGCAINVARTLKNMEMNPYVVSAVGGDTKGSMIINYLKNENFNTDCIKQLKDKESGFCTTILEKGGERTFLTYKGCEAFFSSDMVRDDLLSNTSYVYITGYYLLEERYSQDILNTIDRLKANGSTILFDPGPLVHHIKKDVLKSIISKADVITPNQWEADKIKETLSLNIEPDKWLEAMDIQLIALKQGSKGVQVWYNNVDFFMPSFKIKTVDTTGAGDSFAAGLIYGLSRKFSIYDIVKFANACGALATTFKGPHGKFQIEDIEKIIKDERDEFYDR